MTKQKKSIKVMRIYDYLKLPSKSPAFLVDRLWPRGVSKQAIKNVIWLKELAPLTKTRLEYSHDPDDEIILLTATKDLNYSAATVIKQYLSKNEI
jgi:uncharacterized protein YeaO (DUF488 family)